MSPRNVLTAILALALLSCGANGTYGGFDSDPCAECVGGACAAKCMFAPGEWEGLVLLWQGKGEDAPDCPEGAPELLFDGYTDFIDSPLPCGACSCGPSLCSLPTEMTASSFTNCELMGPDPVEMSLQAPDGWDGTCVVVPTADADEFGSIIYHGTKLSECAPQQGPPEAFLSDVPWETFGRVCKTAAPLVDCSEPTDGCFQQPEPPPSSFARCVRAVAGDAPCPAAYPERHVLYVGMEDTRSCAPCACGPQHGGVCFGAVRVWRDDACTYSQGGMALNATANIGCTSLNSTMEVNSMSGILLDVEPGACDPSGGEPVGEATPLDPTVLCCEAPGGAEE